MKTYYYLGVVIVAAVLGGCASVYETVYEYVPPGSATGRSCIQQCEETLRQCQLVCADKEACELQVRERARSEYEDYVLEQRTRGNPVTRSPNSFLNPRLCADVPGCDCEQEYNACYELCGGAVYAEQIRVR